MKENPSESIQLTWLGDHVSVDPSRQSPCGDQNCQSPDCQEEGCENRRTFFRPQVTINVFNNGGSSVGGSGSGSGSGGSGSATGGSATGGNATVGGNNLHADGDPVSLLAKQLSDLSNKVEQLSSQGIAERVIIDSGVWATTNVRSANEPRQETRGHIRFEQSFNFEPRVIASICYAHVANKTDFRVKVYATSITKEGFIVHADGLNDTKLYACDVSWIAIGK